MKKKISIVTPCYNEEENLEKLCREIKNIMQNSKYDYEHIVIDNNSEDSSIKILKKIASIDKNLKVIINEKNFGHLRSPFYGILQSTGDATIYIHSDFQEPLSLIPRFIEEWERGSRIVLAERISTDTNKFINFLRNLFYKIITRISELKLSEKTTGVGIFDKKVISELKKLRDPYPYFRGLVFEITSDIKTITFHQENRKKGKTKNNFYTLYDLMMLAVVKHSKLPLRIVTIFGLILSFISALVAIIFFIYKILKWDNFTVGIAPIVIGLFGFGAIQLFILGLIGEYVMQILVHERNLPLVIEKERINFDKN